MTKKKNISNSNWTEWSTIQGVIERVISKSDEREARGRFEVTSTINNGNRTEWSPIWSVIIRVINKIGRPRSGSPIC